MPHADSAAVSSEIQTKSEFYASVNENLESLLEGPQKLNWISACSNAASLLHSSFGSFTYASLHRVNWTGFYLLPAFFPAEDAAKTNELLLGPFCGRPACQSLALQPRRAGGTTGVCAKSFNGRSTVIVKDVHSEPGHIACDALTNSEVVVPLVNHETGHVVGVLDIDSEEAATFDQEDKAGLERFAAILGQRTKWPAIMMMNKA